MLDMPNDKGLSVYLAGNVDKCTLLEIPDENISLVPAGPTPPGPAELLGSSRMQELLDEVSPKFDFVLFDSPPVGVVTDSLTLTRYADGTILVVKAGGTTVEMLEGGVKKMGDINARILGVVLNRVKRLEQDSYQYGYGGYYGKDQD